MAYTKEIKDKIKELVKQYPNANSISYGFKEKNGIVTDEQSFIFTFNEKKPLSELNEDEIIPNEIETNGTILKTDVTEGEISFTGEYCPSDFYNWQTTPPSNRNEIRPLKGGLKVRNTGGSYYGTMGFIAVDSDTNSLVGVTNAHVMTLLNSSQGTFFNADEPSRSIYSVYDQEMAQPNTSQSQVVGTTKKYVPIISTNRGGENYVDGAIFTVDESVVNLTESYKYEGFTFTDPPPFATTEEIDELIDNNFDLFSTGARTGAKGQGQTKLKFNAYSTVLLSLPLGGGVNKTAYFYDCIQYYASASTTTPGQTCFYPINGGDSGSALLADINGTVKIIGLCFAGSSYPLFTRGYACRIDKVAEQLNIEAFTGQTVNYSNTTTPQIHYEPGFSSMTAVTINGKVYYQLGTVS